MRFGKCMGTPGGHSGLPYLGLWHITGTCGTLRGLTAPYGNLQCLMWGLQCPNWACGALRGLAAPYGGKDYIRFKPLPKSVHFCPKKKSGLQWMKI